MTNPFNNVMDLLSLVVPVCLFLTFLTATKSFFSVRGSGTATAWLLIGGGALLYGLNFAVDFLKKIYNLEGIELSGYFNFFGALSFLGGSIAMVVTLKKVLPRKEKEPSMYQKIVKGKDGGEER